jgi:hypothetical protein
MYLVEVNCRTSTVIESIQTSAEHGLREKQFRKMFLKRLKELSRKVKILQGALGNNVAASS